MLNIRTKDWIIIRNNLTDIKSCNKTFLTEDLFQAKKNDYTIDVGWYENINKFTILLIQKENWDTPIVHIQCNTYRQILFGINFCLDYYNELL